MRSLAPTALLSLTGLVFAGLVPAQAAVDPALPDQLKQLRAMVKHPRMEEDFRAIERIRELAKDADKRAPKEGRTIDQVGTYDPLPNPPVVDFKKEKLHEWMRRGALPSQTVAQLIKRAGIAPGETT